MHRNLGRLYLFLAVLLALATRAFADPMPAPAPESTPPAAPAPQVSPAPSPSPDTEKEDSTFYLQYLKNERPLGFNPDESLYERVKVQIKEEFVDNVTDAQMLNGVADEVHKLLVQADLDPSALDKMPKDEGLPQAIVAAYGPKVSKDLLWYAIIRGELAGLSDPYSVLMPPDDFKHMMDSMNEHTFGGVGIYIELDKNNGNKLTIVEPIEDTPAWKSGLQAGDVIAKIDGRKTDGMSLDEAAALLRGPVGSKVEVVIERAKEEASTIAITRANIRPVSVNSKMLDNHIGYVRLRIFGDHTNFELQDALQSLKKQGMRSLILDLRNNGGGYINAAVDICSNFIPPGDLVVSVEPRMGPPEEYRAKTTAGDVYKMPMVLLVNNYSASASEITAGCLKDLGIATLVGVKTFGKGSVQNVVRLSQGAALKLTIAHFFSPKHHIIHHVGIVPDVEIPMEPRLVGHWDSDTQLLKAEEVIRQQVGIQK